MAVAIPTNPAASTTNGDASGFVESSTLIDCPVPRCVTLKAALVEFTSTTDGCEALKEEAVRFVNMPVEPVIVVNCAVVPSRVVTVRVSKVEPVT